MKKIIPIFLSVVLLLCLMAYQVTGEQAHEWIGVGMILLVIFHQILNKKWYAAIFKGKYHAYRIVATAVNLLLLHGRNRAVPFSAEWISVLSGAVCLS